LTVGCAIVTVTDNSSSQEELRDVDSVVRLPNTRLEQSSNVVNGNVRYMRR